MSVIHIEHLTKDYGHGRGVFDISFDVEKGEVFGFLGPNGAGKTTAIRHIMGFSRPMKGHTQVNGLDSWRCYDVIQKDLGYLPGEIAMPESLTGVQFIRMMAELRGLRDMTKTETLLKTFALDPAGGLKRMSLGMKRKLAIVTAFMHDPSVLVLDEPTSGLDPIMQEQFIKFIRNEKALGKTILLSSHIFSEVDATCDRIAIIKEGRLVSIFDAEALRHNTGKEYKLEFIRPEDYQGFLEEGFEIAAQKKEKLQVKVLVNDDDINRFIAVVAGYEIKYLSETKMTLEDYFMGFYDRNKTTEQEGGRADAACTN